MSIGYINSSAIYSSCGGGNNCLRILNLLPKPNFYKTKGKSNC